MAMTATPLAWMRRYWPVTTALAYLLCYGLISLVGLLWHLPPEVPRGFGGAPDVGLLWHLPRENPRHFHNLPDILGAVLFATTVFGVRCAHVGRRRFDGVAVVVLSLVGQGWFIYSDFDAARSAAFLADFPRIGDDRISRLPDAAMRSNRGHPGHSGRLIAQFYFHETGIPIPYRDDHDEVRVFEPDAKATTAREGKLEGQEILAKSRPMFRAYVVTFRWFGYSNLLLAVVAIFGAMGLFWRRKSRVAIESPAKQPVLGQ
jgi:hypothetical protein